MELKKLVDELNEMLYKEMCDGCRNDESFKIFYATEDCEIEVELKGEWDVEVNIYHADTSREHDDTNITVFLETQIEPDWEAVQDYWRDYEMDEWEAHGFRDEADFWRWKEG